MSQATATQTEDDDDPITLRLLKHIDALLDRYLCKSCQYEKNKLPLSALKTWKPDANVCSECKYIFDDADDPDPDVRNHWWSKRGWRTKAYWSSAESSSSSSSSSSSEDDDDDDDTPLR